MKEKVTPEQVLEMGEAWYKLLIRQMSPEERLAELTTEERLAGLSPEEVLAQYKPEEVLAQYKPEERLAGLSLEEVEAWLEKQRAAGQSRTGNVAATLNQ